MRSALSTLCLLAMLPAAAVAAVPPIISYQAALTGSSGAPVADGTYSIQFAVYDAATGGTALWSETNTGVEVRGGMFSVLLGGVNNLPADIFNGPDRWLGVKIGSDPEMAPRHRIASVAYAFVAESVPDGAVTASKLAQGIAIPPGAILMWSGTVANIPAGWALCDGTNGTPDLRDKFVVGARQDVGGVAKTNVSGQLTQTGGEAQHTLTVAEMPAHTHPTANLSLAGGGTAIYNSGGYAPTPETGSAGGNQPHENCPPYYALCFIYKLPY